MAKRGRNEPCPCGSGRKAKRCCGVARGPSAESLARAFVTHGAREGARDLAGTPDDDFETLSDELTSLPQHALSLHVELPKLHSPTLARLVDAIQRDDLDDGAAPFAETVAKLDTPSERARLARAVMTLRDGGRLDRKLAAVALIDLLRERSDLVAAGVFTAAAVRAGTARTPGGLMLAA